jgi:hypothetical protein
MRSGETCAAKKHRVNSLCAVGQRYRAFFGMHTGWQGDEANSATELMPTPWARTYRGR